MIRASGEPLKLRGPFKAIGGDRVSLRVEEGSLLLPITTGDSEGYYVRGRGVLLLDSIIETPDGAIGRPVKRMLDEPFILLGRTDCEPDVEGIEGNCDVESLIREAEELAGDYRGDLGGRRGRCAIFRARDGVDALVVDGDQLVYRESNMVYVSGGKNDVLVDRDRGLAVSKSGRTVTIENGCIHLNGRRRKISIGRNGIVIRKG